MRKIISESGIRDIRELSNRYKKAKIYFHQDLDGVTTAIAMRDYLESNGIDVVGVPLTTRNVSSPAMTMSLLRLNILVNGRLDDCKWFGKSTLRCLSHSETALGMATDHVLLWI